MTVAAGSRILASDIQALQVPYARKTSDQSVTSSTTLVNDTQLVVAVSASNAYKFDLVLLYKGAAAGTGDLKFAWSVPAGATVVSHLLFADTGLVARLNYQTATTSPPMGTNGTGNPLSLRCTGTIVVSSTPGSLQLQWAQNTSNATATTVLTGSSLTLTNIT